MPNSDLHVGISLAENSKIPQKIKAVYRVGYYNIVGRGAERHRRLQLAAINFPSLDVLIWSPGTRRQK